MEVFSREFRSGDKQQGRGRHIAHIIRRGETGEDGMQENLINRRG